MHNNSEKTELTRNDIYQLLKEFANSYRKYGKGMHSEIIIVGGGSIVLNYRFRSSTIDIDAIMNTSSVTKDIILNLSRKHNIQDDWLNDDFKYTNSFSEKISIISEHYCYFNNRELEIRTVKAEYLIAMKMISSRQYSQDISDIIGILMIEKKNGNNIGVDDIKKAVKYLYPSEITPSSDLWDFVSKCCDMSVDELEKEYNIRIKKEIQIAEIIDDYSDTEVRGKNTMKNVAEQIAKKLEQKNEKL